MSLLSRRGFMKTLLVTAASPWPLWVDSSRANLWLPPTENEPAAASATLEHGGQRLQVSSPGSPFAFQNFLRVAAAELVLQDEATYLLYEQLRMFYWYSDPSQNNYDIRGMVQAAASILYPAFKENVEAILPWTGIMKRGIVSQGLLCFMNQQRRNNFSFFEKCSGDREKVEMAFIPLENLGTLELGGQTGNVGKEIYGTGECLWMYLMFEALGQVQDRELMMVNLDLLDMWDAQQFPPRQAQFILYNPTPGIPSARIAIPPGTRSSAQLGRKRHARPGNIGRTGTRLSAVDRRVRIEQSTRHTADNLAPSIGSRTQNYQKRGGLSCQL